jgi:hypothetical protein
MIGRHDFLARVARKEAGIMVEKLRPGDLLCFVNRKMDKLALLSFIPEAESHGVLGYYKSPGGRKINERALRYIPQSYGANGSIDMDAATRKAILEQLGMKDQE